MAVTVQGAALTEQHRQLQAARAAALYMLVYQHWQRIFDPGNPVQTAEQWVARVLPLIVAANGRSAALSRAYLSTFRTLELGRLEPFTPAPIKLIPEEQVRTSLWVTGPVALNKKLEKISGLDISPALEKSLLADAVDEAGQQAAGAALKHAVAGSRDQIKEAAREDRTALGWMRVAKPDACYFCQMLVSRGPVYDKESFADSNSFFTGEGVSKAHDNCACTLQPVYSRKDKGNDQTQAMSDLWATSTAGKSGKEAILAFRRAYEGRAATLEASE